MSRSRKSAKNLLFSIIGQFFGLVISFFARIIFIKILGGEYLGLNGLFTNILTVLSLAELGVGEAINFSLYKPLAENDTFKCQMLMQFYKKIYTIIGITVLLLGIVITPFLSFFINEVPDIPNLNVIFILFVVNTSISYFFSYKRNLIIADQNRYIATIYRYSFYFILNAAQIVFLIITKNYIAFLLLQILCTLLENLFVSLKANRMYPYLKNKDKISLDNSTKTEIVKNTKAMMMHKIGGIVVTSTDNILLSKFVDLVTVGIYSNYYLVINALNTVFTQFYTSIIASVGNLCAKENTKKQYEVFNKVDFLGFWIYSFSSVSFICLINHFIQIWIGENYLFQIDIVLVLTINFYLTGMRKSVMTFREAAGLFYKDRWKAIIEAIVNLVVSIILVTKYGTIGIFLGTMISSISVCIWVEPYILFKYSFNKKLSDYFKKYFKYLMITIISGAITFYLCSIINFGLYLSFFIKILICFLIPNLIIIMVFNKNENFIFYKEIFIKYSKKILKRKKKSL